MRVERPGQSDWTAAYDPLGRRVWKAWGEHKVEYFWDTDRLAAERDEMGRTRVYVYADPFALRIQPSDRQAALLTIEVARQRFLSRAGGADVALAQTAKRRYC